MATLIFDFDGTIADTLTAIVQITNRLAPAYGFTPTTPDRLAHFRTLTPQQLIEQSEIPLFRMPFLIRRVRRELRQEIPNISPIHGLPEVLVELAQCHQLMIVSSNAASNIQQFLTLNQLTGLFDPIYANVGLLGKARRLRRILNRHGLLPSHTLYVGDETRDIAAAHQIGLPVTAVSWGFSSLEALQNQQPTFVATKPAQLQAIASQIGPQGVRPNRGPARPDAQTTTQSFAPLSAD